MRSLVSPDEARAAIESLDIGAGVETVDPAAARGRVLAGAITAEADVPGFDRASMDGYAVRARDTASAGEADPATLRVVGDLPAGEEPTVAVGAGEAVEIATGAVRPPGADAVVAVERTDPAEGDAVDVRTSVTPGENVMAAGADVAAGQRSLAAGTRLTPRTVGLLSALGRDEVTVRGRPTVGVVSTGDELVPPGEALDPDAGQIHDVNAPALATAVEGAGGRARRYDRVGDDADALRDALATAAAECDLVLTSGSTSAGATDVLYRIVEESGDLLVHGVAVKPGKPTAIGRFDGTPYVGLPGYPVSALSIFRLFVAPALRRAAGLPEAAASTTGTLAVEERFAEGRHRAIPVGLVTDGDGETLVYPVDRGSGATTSLAYADGVVEMDADANYRAAGEPVDVDLFSASARPPAVLGVGDPDPLFDDALAAVDRPRYLADGSRAGERSLRDGVADVAVVCGAGEKTGSDGGDSAGGEELARWRREWGIVVPPNSDGADELADLADGDRRFVNLSTDLGLRTALDDAVAERCDADFRERVDGYGFETFGVESPARRVESGAADAGLGLRATADRLGLGFVPIGRQTVRAVAASDRIDKPGVSELATALDEVDVDDRDGYDRL